MPAATPLFALVTRAGPAVKRLLDRITIRLLKTAVAACRAAGKSMPLQSETA